MHGTLCCFYLLFPHFTLWWAKPWDTYFVRAQFPNPMNLFYSTSNIETYIPPIAILLSLNSHQLGISEQFLNCSVPIWAIIQIIFFVSFFLNHFRQFIYYSSLSILWFAFAISIPVHFFFLKIFFLKSNFSGNDCNRYITIEIGNYSGWISICGIRLYEKRTPDNMKNKEMGKKHQWFIEKIIFFLLL